MPILDKLNNKLEESGVEQRGRTIEEAVDLLPAMGGSGGMQLEQIGTEHNGHWFDSRGQCKIKYYQLGGAGSCLFVIRIVASGPPVALNTITEPFVIDDNPNILVTDIMGNCDGFTGGVIASNGSADYARLFVGMNTNTKKLHILPDSNNTSNIAAFNTYMLVIAKLADNIT